MNYTIAGNISVAEKMEELDAGAAGENFSAGESAEISAPAQDPGCEEAVRTYTITEISRMFDLPTSTIRYYEKIGLLENVEHVNSYRRVYTRAHVDRLNAVECFKKALLPLEDIKLFFAYEKDMSANSDKILEMMTAQREKTLESMKNLETGLAHLQKKIKFYGLVNEAVKNNDQMPVWSEVFPEKN